MTNYTHVYILKSKSNPNHHYTGLTTNPTKRLTAHNTAKVTSTANKGPWQFETVISFRNRTKALAFEKYLKSHSGRAFASKHF